MSLITLQGVDYGVGGPLLLEAVNLTIEPNERVCIVGRNGAGKSTLMKVVMGLIEPDSGDRSIQSAVRFAYVPQEPVIVGDTLLDYAASGAAGLATTPLSRASLAWDAQRQLESSWQKFSSSAQAASARSRSAPMIMLP